MTEPDCVGFGLGKKGRAIATPTQTVTRYQPKSTLSLGQQPSSLS
ncbi:MAG: hypothetical protein AB1861_24290 [Cyanobacteriota bacterium]